MLKVIVTTCTFVAASLGSLGAQAAPAAETGWYGGLGVGRSYADPSGVAGSTDDKDTAWKAFGGYQFNRYFGAEAGYVDLGKSSILGPTGDSAAFDSKVWHANAVGSLPLSDQFALTGKLGIARTDTDVSGVIGGVPVAGGTDHNTAPTYGLGLRYDINKSFGVRGDWDRYRVSSSPIAGKSDTDLFSVSGVFRF